MNYIVKKNIGIIPPMKFKFLRPQYIAASAVSMFAVRIFEKYSNYIEYNSTAESFVFLQKFNNELKQEQQRYNEMMLTLKVMIGHHLAVSGKVPDLTINNTYINFAGNKVDASLAFLKLSDSELYYNITNALQIIKSDSEFNNLISQSSEQKDLLILNYSAENNYQNEVVNNLYSKLIHANNYIIGDVYSFNSLIFRKKTEEKTVGENVKIITVNNELLRKNSDTIAGTSRIVQENIDTTSNSSEIVHKKADATSSDRERIADDDISEIYQQNKKEKSSEGNVKKEIFEQEIISNNSFLIGKETDRAFIPVMNSFLSNGYTYISDISNRHIQKNIFTVTALSKFYYNALKMRTVSALPLVTNSIRTLAFFGIQNSKAENNLYSSEAAFLFNHYTSKNNELYNFSQNNSNSVVFSEISRYQTIISNIRNFGSNRHYAAINNETNDLSDIDNSKNIFIDKTRILNNFEYKNNQENTYSSKSENKAFNIPFMNTFFSEGFRYIWNINERYTYNKATASTFVKRLVSDFNENVSENSFLIVRKALDILTTNKHRNKQEKAVFDYAVSTVFRNRFIKDEKDTVEMFKDMSRQERTDVLLLLTKRLVEISGTDIGKKIKYSDKNIQKRQLSPSEVKLVYLLENNKATPVLQELVLSSFADKTVSKKLQKLYLNSVSTEKTTVESVLKNRLDRILKNTIVNFPIVHESINSNLRTIGHREVIDIQSVNASLVQRKNNIDKTVVEAISEISEMVISSSDYFHDVFIKRILERNGSTYKKSIFAQKDRLVLSKRNFERNISLSHQNEKNLELQNVDINYERLSMNTLNNVFARYGRTISGASAPHSSVADNITVIDVNKVQKHLSVNREQKNSGLNSLQVYQESPIAGELDALSYQLPQKQPVSVERTLAPSTDELIKQYGNLIEGADAKTMLGIGDNMNTRVIPDGKSGIMVDVLAKATEEVKVNAKHIEEIEKKQRELEETVLKGIDADTIVADIMRKIKTQLRYDKSRYFN